MRPHTQDVALDRTRKAKSHRSLPKTERKRLEESRMNPSVLKTQGNWMQHMTPPKGEHRLKVTLSQMSSTRKEHAFEDISRYRDLTSALYRMRLDESIYPSSADYFKPLTLGMNSLREEALNTADFPNTSNPFYRSESIEARLIKEHGYRFTLSLRNTGDSAVLIGFKDMSQYKHSNQITILNWGNKRSESYFPSFSLLKQNYLDIKFTAYIADTALRFLPFDLALNGQDSFLLLPITLLDMADPRHILGPNDLEQFALSGTAAVSEPLGLASEELPLFLGGFRFKCFYPKNIDQFRDHIIGGCMLQVPAEKYLGAQMKRVAVLVRLLSYPSRLVELVVLHRKRDAEEERFSRAVLQLLRFLLR
jgi:hypothetical protein